MRTSHMAMFLVMGLSIASLVGCQRGTSVSLQEPSPETSPKAALQWQLCRYDHNRPPPVASPGDALCAVMTVPENPTASSDPATVQIPVIRRTATHPDNTVGTLIYFPPSMNGSGIDQIIDNPILAGLEKNFDVVSLNPRGVTGKFMVFPEQGKTQALCDKSTLQDAAPFFRDPVTTVEILEKIRVKSAAVYRSCSQISHVDHLDAITMAYDVEQLRQSLGVKTISLYAHGYSTLAAQAYSRLFPEHTRAIVLDAPLPPTLTGAQLVQHLAGAFEGGFQRFVDWCRGEEDCALGTKDPWEVLEDVTGEPQEKETPSTNEEESPTQDSTEKKENSREAHLVYWQIEQILSTSNYPQLAQFLDALSTKKPFPDAPTDHIPDDAPVQYPLADFRLCEDIDAQIAPNDVETASKAALQASPHFGFSPYANRIVGLCTGFPVITTTADVKTVSSPTLVIAGRGNIRSPFTWAETVQRQLGDKSTLISVDDGSDEVRIVSSGPAQQALTTFLVSLKAPPQGSVFPPH